MDGSLIAVLTSIGIVALVVFGIFALFMTLYVKVEQGRAMIVNTMRKEPEVTFTGSLVIPVIHKAEMMDISIKTIEIDRNGGDGLICNDNIRADIKVAFFVRVNKNTADVLEVAQTIGCARASDETTLEELFAAKFSEALKTVGKRMEFEDLYRKRDEFRDAIIQLIGKDLNGYVLEDAAIDYLEQTPLSQLDDQNILDSQGIRKITMLTAEQHVHTNLLRRQEELKIKKQDVETREHVLELERQQIDAEAKQQREIDSMQAREQAETDKIVSEEKLKSENARLETEEQVAVRDQNKLREVEVAQKNRERAVVIETEKVERVRQLEAISREKEVELQQIAKQKALEEEKKAIADVVRSRIVVDKTVAEEEERIKEVRVVSEADRQKQVKVINAEALAQEDMIKEIKAAEASEQKAKLVAREQVIMAEAELETAQRQAESTKRIAEGMQAEEAAPGLAKARVTEATAIADEKAGLAEARVLFEKMQANAKGEEVTEMARVRVKEADAIATKIKLQVEAEGIEMKGMAEVKVKEADAASEEKQAMVAVNIRIADAEAIEKQAMAEAQAIRSKFHAEAEGLTAKFAAMASMDDSSRDHEEFRMKLEVQRKVMLDALVTNEKIAATHAQVLGQALKDANIDIVGGDGQFLERFLGAISMGKSIDGVLENSETAKLMMKDYVSGDKNLLADTKDLIAGVAGASEDVKNLTVSTFLSSLMKNGDHTKQDKIKSLMKIAKDLGID